MTRPDDSGTTRPISVAELLARNGTIGSPPVGGRRRRRRGNADAVTVAELTGEIPVIRDTDTKPPATPPVTKPPVEEAAPEPAPEPAEEAADTPATETDEVEASTEAGDDELEDSDLEFAAAEADVEDADGDTDSVADYAAEIEQRLSTPEAPAPDAEHMSPDPVVIETDEDAADEDEAADVFEAVVLEETDTPDLDDLDAEAALAADDTDDTRATDRDELPSYLRSTSSEPLFGGQVADDDAAEADLVDEEADEEYDEPRRMSSVVHGLWIVGQSLFAVVFGAGLFVAFDQLWKWNNIVALVLSVLVILGLVVAVRVVRKTEDIGSTLIAVAVGALVTLGPLALLQSG